MAHEPLIVSSQQARAGIDCRRCVAIVILLTTIPIRRRLLIGEGGIARIERYHENQPTARWYRIAYAQNGHHAAHADWGRPLPRWSHVSAAADRSEAVRQSNALSRHQGMLSSGEAPEIRAGTSSSLEPKINTTWYLMGLAASPASGSTRPGPAWSGRTFSMRRLVGGVGAAPKSRVSPDSVGEISD